MISHFQVNCAQTTKYGIIVVLPVLFAVVKWNQDSARCNVFLAVLVQMDCGLQKLVTVRKDTSATIRYQCYQFTKI